MQKPWFARPRVAFHKRHAIVIGAGLAGSCIAYSLARRGWRVSVIERYSTVAGEASGIAAGVIMPRLLASAGAEGRFHRLAYRHTLTLLDRLQAAGQAIEQDRCGALLLATSENERRRQQKMIDSRQWPPKSLQSLSREAAVAASQVELPGGGLWLAQSGWLNPASLCRALLTAGSVEIRHDAEVAQLISAGGGWQIRDRAGRPCGEAEVIIIANGRGAATFVQTRWLPLSLIRGQTTRLRATPQSRRLSSVLCAGVYLTPAIGEHHILGATFQRDEKAIDLRATDDEENMRQLAAVAPALASSLGTGESQHAAIRAATPDRLPAVGAVVDYAAFLDDYAELWKGKAAHHYPPARHLPGLYLMAGFGARGITTAPLAAELLAAMIDGTELPVDAALADALNPARFLIKRLRRAAIDPDQAIQ